MKLSGGLGNWCLSLCSIFLWLFVLVGQVAGQQAPTTVNQVWVLTNANGSGGPPAWIQIMPAGGPPPTKIFGASVVYDSSNNRLILFGGNDGSFPTNDVWVLANANGLGGVPTWTQLAPSGPLPPARDNHAAVYDSANNRMVIFGGCSGSCLPALNDVWVLTNANGLGGAPTWTELVPTVPTGLPPAPRIGMASAYDPASNKLILFGGQTGGASAGDTFPEVWVLTNANGLGGAPMWTLVRFGGGPPPGQYQQSYAFDSANDCLMVAGGFINGSAGAVTNAVWVLANANDAGMTPPIWTNLIADIVPPPPGFKLRPAVFDPQTGRMIVAGDLSDGTSNLDAWLVNNANGINGPFSWTQLLPTGGPPPGHAAWNSTGVTAYDQLHNRLIGFLVVTGVAATTTTTLISSANPSVFGQLVTFTATVHPATGSATPTGTVSFNDGAATLGTGTLSGGQAIFTAASLSVGSHSITAAYGGDSSFAGSTSPALMQVVNQASTATTLISSANPSVLGQLVTFTATVSPANGSATPTGTVSFKDGAVTLYAGTLSGGQASFTAASLSVGSHSITAAYGGDSSFAGSTSPALMQVVNQASTTTTLISSANPSVLGQLVTFTATVNPASGSLTPTGTVSFKDGAATLGAGTLSGGKASFTTVALSVGSHSITAVYWGDSSFTGSTSSALMQVVNQTSTTTTLISSANPSVFGQLVTFTATVNPASGSLTPTGTVSFKDGPATLGAYTLSGGQASFTTVAFSVGSHSITALYWGDSSFTGSTSSALMQVVNQTSTTTTLISSANPSVFGQLVTFTATVNPASGSLTPTGTVSFRDGPATLGAYTLSGGKASFTTASFSVRSHSITAVYGGDSSFASSTSPALMQVVNQASTTTTTTLISSANPSVFGQLVTFSATVNPVSGSLTPTGTVSFKDGAVTLGVGTLSGGKASLTAAALSVGSHSITAVYGGDSSFTGSTSPALMQVVNQASTLTAVSSSVNPSSLHQAVTFTASVSVTAPGAGHPSGTVTFNDGTTTLATVALNSGGMASFTTAALELKSHSITAVYSGDGNFSGSSGSLTQNVGYFICVLFDQSKPIEREESFRIKVELCDANGVDVSTRAIKLHVTAITQISGSPGRPASPRDAGNEHEKETDFRFVRNLGTTGGYVYKLRTEDLAPGTYSLQFIVGSDPTTHTLMFRIGQGHDREDGRDGDSSKGHRDRG